MSDKYQSGDRIFAKIKGYPPWPAMVAERVPASGKIEQYKIYFYGTYEAGYVKSDQMFPYTDENKVRYGKPQRKQRFKEAMEEIDRGLLIDDGGLAPADDSQEEDDDDEEGDLLIDESPSLPPILKREVNKPTTPPVVEPAKPRRLTKATKRDSTGTNVSISGVSTPTIETPPQTEIVSRSGRKIKPKRFADDEIVSPVINITKSSASPHQSIAHDESGDLDGPPSAKRPKRTKSAGSKVVARAEVEKEVKPKPVVGKGRISRHSPDISDPIPKAVKTRTAKNNTQIQSVVSTAAPPQSKIPKLKAEPELTKPEEETDYSTGLVPTEQNDVDDKENSKGSWMNENTDADSVSNDSTMTQPQKLDNSVNNIGGGKLQVAAKNGLDIELTFGNDCPKLESQEEKAAWNETTIKNVLKLKEDLEQYDGEANEIISKVAKTVESNESMKQAKLREKKDLKIKQLRLEGEVIEIIGEIVSCLNVKTADCDRAIELLDRMASHQLNSLMLKKHPEVVDTVRKLRSYVGNVHNWVMTSEDEEDFRSKALGIRQKSRAIYDNFKTLFCSNDDASRTFIVQFNEEVQKFKDSVQGLPPKVALSLTSELTDTPVEELELMDGDSDDNGN